jgi:hypothetical protein
VEAKPDADDTREVLRQLEWRVSELERFHRDARRRSRRTLWLMALGVVVYVLFFLLLTNTI